MTFTTNRRTRRAMMKLMASGAAVAAGLRRAQASGTMTVSQLGTDALSVVNAASAAIAAVQGLPPADTNGKPITIPPNLLTALSGVQSAAQALTSVSASGTQVQQFMAAVSALMPIVMPFLAGAGPWGAGIAIAIAAINALMPEIAQLTNQPAPASASLKASAILPPMTPALARQYFGPK